MRDYLYLHLDDLEILDKLTNVEAGKLINNLFHFAKYNFLPENIEQLDKIIAFPFIQRIKNHDKSCRIKHYHWNWKGGISNKNQVIRNSIQNKEWRTNVFTRDNFTCQKCYISGGILHAHHIKPFALFPELRFDLNNGITLCKNCHIEVHKK